ncbi:MAG: hypothetical protein K6E69_08490 [Treponema sp.]|uniref:hypothetical protein n=1 Tax=Treponema sp. TaxID=166 RepID=UPI00298EB425|nr:hypothetical protein [Treponema sp.]MCR5387145.1 hypothetical protein [Treponema sp.]
MVGTTFADDAHGFIEPTIGGFTIKDINDIRMMDEVVEIWDIDSMTYHWGCFSYKPTSIKYDNKNKETVRKWFYRISAKDKGSRSLCSDFN